MCDLVGFVDSVKLYKCTSLGVFIMCRDSSGLVMFRCFSLSDQGCFILGVDDPLVPLEWKFMYIFDHKILILSF